MSKYIFGIDYGPRDLRLALVEASDHKVGTPVDRLLLYCYHYDPTTGKYGLVLMNVLRLGGVLTVVLIGGIIVLHAAARKARAGRTRRARRARGELTMPALPLFPARSVHDGREGRRPLFLPGRGQRFLRRPHRGAGGGLRHPLPAAGAGRDGPGGRAVAGAGAGVDRHPALPRPGDVRLGREALLHPVAAAGRDAGRLRRRQAVDVEVPAPERQARDQRAARPGRACDPADGDLRGRHPLLLRAGVPHQGRRDPRTLHGRCGSTRPRSGRYHLFCVAVLRDAPLGDDRRGHRDAERPTTRPGSAAACRTCRSPRRDSRRSRTCRASPATGRTARAAAPSLVGVFGSKVELDNGQTVVADDAYIRESILSPTAKIVAGYTADHADVPGPGQRGAAADAHRVRQVAEGTRIRGPPQTPESRTPKK